MSKVKFHPNKTIKIRIPEFPPSKVLSLKITNWCNFSCEFCVATDNDNSNPKYMSLSKVYKTLCKAKEIGIKAILISGGEPTLHPSVVDIAKMCKKMKFYTIITTNYSNPKIIKELDGICDAINISLYNKNELCIPEQKDFKSTLYLKVVLYSDRFNSLDDFNDFIEKYSKKIPKIIFSHLIICNDWCKSHNILPKWFKEIPFQTVLKTNSGYPWKYLPTSKNTLVLLDPKIFEKKPAKLVKLS